MKLCLPVVIWLRLSFPGSSAGKESACNEGDPGSIPGLGRFPGEGIGYPLPYSWASLVAQDSKEAACNAGDLSLVPGLGRSPGGGHGNPIHILAWRIPMTEELGGLQSMGSQRVGHNWATKHSTAQESSPATQDRQGALQVSRLASLKVLEWPTRGSLCFSTCSWCLRPLWNPACPSRGSCFPAVSTRVVQLLHSAWACVPGCQHFMKHCQP